MPICTFHLSPEAMSVVAAEQDTSNKIKATDENFLEPQISSVGNNMVPSI
jgi:hypothetical protein